MKRESNARRRSTRRALLAAVAAWPAFVLARDVFAQRKPPIVIGWLNTGSRNEGSLTAFREGMAALGWIEARDYALEERWADGKLDRVSALARELAAKKAVVIVAAPGRAALELTKAAPNTPVV